MTYRAPTDDFQFLFDHIIGFANLSKTNLFAEATPDIVAPILSEAAKMCEEVLAPLNRSGDLSPAILENGVVRTSPGFGDGFKAVADGGWIGMSADPEYGGMGLPLSLQNAVNDMMASSCLSLQLSPLMTQGQIEALEHHASDALKNLYLPKLISGEWSGTMNLTEPQAGSDVGALASKAVDNGDGTFAITGQKVFISWGDADFAGNICHLVLARLPDAPNGTKGISLFLVPKWIPDDQGNPGEQNSLRVISLEHKMGLHGSPTAVMSFEGATGWMVATPNNGMSAMFTMMNNARLGVGVQGYGVGERAYQEALAYAMDRKQGRSPLGDQGTGAIIDHADVRRMLTQMKSEIFAARAMAMTLAMALDMARATGEEHWSARAALLTPIVKSYGTEVGFLASHLGIQIHGGMGFIEETGAAQHLRDVRVTAIYEGTNGIQAMDLVGRKLMDGGDAAFRLLDEIEALAESARSAHPAMTDAVWSAAEDLRETTEWMVAQSDTQDRFAGSVPFLLGFARVLGADFHLRAAIAEGGSGPRTELARFYINRLLPEHSAHFAQARSGAQGLYALSPEDLAS
jgi:alkylation response protein AidB-like acyl-CoA dehydrogenase